VKANSNLHILSLLRKLGAGVDLVSYGELKRASKVGFLPEKMVFSGVGKTPEEIQASLSLGIFSFHIESLEEFETFCRLIKVGTPTIRVALRFNPDVNPKTHPYISTGLKSNKFGMNSKEIFQLLKIQRPKNLQICGLSQHIGSQILSLAPFEEAFQKLKEMAIQVEKILGHSLEFLDIGGGCGIRYHREVPLSIERYTQLIRKYFSRNGSQRQRWKILLEPGRSLMGNSGVLLTQVLYRKNREKMDFLIVDAGMNDLMRPALYQSYHEILPVKERLLGNRVKRTHVAGPVCESSDIMGHDRKLSQDLKQQDLLAILTAGAYGMSMSSTYNSRVRPAEVLVYEKKAKLIRKREDFEDLWRDEC
jgi:diaminopimelate decarboxylase